MRKTVILMAVCAAFAFSGASDAFAGGWYTPRNLCDVSFSFKSGYKTYTGTLSYDQKCEEKVGDCDYNFDSYKDFCKVSIKDNWGRDCKVDTSDCKISFCDGKFEGVIYARNNRNNA